MSPPPGGGGWSREGGHQGSPKGPEPGRAEVRRFHSFATTVFEAWEGGCNRKVKYYPGSGHLQSHRVIKLQDKSKLDWRLHSRWERPGGWWKETVKYSPLQRASERWTQTQSSGRVAPSWEQLPGSHWEAVDGRPGNRGHGSPWGPGHPQGLSHPRLCHLCPCTGELRDRDHSFRLRLPRPLGRLAAPCVSASVHLCLLDPGGDGHPRQTSLGLVSGGQPFTTSYRDQGWRRSFHQKCTE